MKKNSLGLKLCIHPATLPGQISATHRHSTVQLIFDQYHAGW